MFLEFIYIYKQIWIGWSHANEPEITSSSQFRWHIDTLSVEAPKSGRLTWMVLISPLWPKYPQLQRSKMCIYIYIYGVFFSFTVKHHLYIFILKPENKRDETSIYSFICCNLICSFKLWKRDLFQKQFSSHRSCANFWHHWGGHGRVVPKAIVAWCWC